MWGLQFTSMTSGWPPLVTLKSTLPIPVRSSVRNAFSAIALASRAHDLSSSAKL